MTSSCLSVISFYKGYLRRAFTSAGLSSQTINIDSETTIHFWGPTRGLAVTAIKPSLLLIHGFGPLSYWYWHQQVPILAPQFNLYIPDLIFFGESTTTSSDRSEVFQAVSIGKLLDKIGVKRFSVMGASYGGFVAYQMAKMWPERVEKVVLLSSAINKKKKDEDDLLGLAKVEKIEDLMIPMTNKNMRTLIGLVMAKRYRVLPNFVVADLINVSVSFLSPDNMTCQVAYSIDSLTWTSSGIIDLYASGYMSPLGNTFLWGSAIVYPEVCNSTVSKLVM